MFQAHVVALALVLVVLSGLSRPPSRPAPHQVRTAPEVEVLPISGPTVQLAVRLDRPATVRVEYTSADEHPLTVESARADREHLITLARLLPGVEYRYRVQADGDSAVGIFESAPLPAPLQELRIEASGRSSVALALLEISHPTGFSGPVVVDARGRIVWYFPTEGDIHGVVRRSGGNFVFLDVDRGLLEVTPAGEVVARLEQTENRRIHHDVDVTEDGRVLYLAREWRMIDGDSVRGEAIWSWDPGSGAEEKLWSAFEHLDPSLDRGPRSRNRNWLHANSLAVGPRGNLVVGLSFLDQVVSITPDLSGFEWRLGGPGATHAVVGAPFSGQHSAAEVEPARVLLFDNGFGRWEPPRFEGAHARAVEYELVDGEARPVWEFRSPNHTWSRVVSSAIRLDNGNTLVAFGAVEGLRSSRGPMEVFEVDPSARPVWRLQVEGPVRTLYRATPLAGVGGEVR